MAIQVTINNLPYTLNQQGDAAPWGDNLSALIQAIVTSLNGLQGPNDIPTSSFTVANNTTSPTNITTLYFNTSSVRAAFISYSIYRSTASAELAEAGQIYLVYSSTAGTWQMSQTYVGSGGITFAITNAGQLTYTSTNMSGSGYQGKLTFKATTFVQ